MTIKRILALSGLIAMLLLLCACQAQTGPTGCVGWVNGKCVQTGTPPPAMF